MTSALILALPNFAKPFIVRTDASGTTMGVVLMQLNHPIAFFSKAFRPRLLHASTYIRELHAIVTAVRKWRQYLLGRSFTILTYHKSLRELMTQVIQTPKQHYYLSKLLGFDYTIQYKFGSSNVIADALSRVPSESGGQLLLLLVPQLDFLDDLHRTLQASSKFQAQLSEIHTNPSAYPDFHIHNDLLLFKGRIWINKLILTFPPSCSSSTLHPWKDI